MKKGCAPSQLIWTNLCIFLLETHHILAPQNESPAKKWPTMTGNVCKRHELKF